MTGQHPFDSTPPPSRAVQRLVEKYRAGGANESLDDAALLGIASRTVRVRRQVLASAVAVLALIAGLILIFAGSGLLGVLLMVFGVFVAGATVAVVMIDQSRIRT